MSSQTVWSLVLGAAACYGVYKMYCNYKKVTTVYKKPVLHGLKISHYVEKTRWTLKLLGVDFEERFSYPVFGVVLNGRTLPTLELSGRTMLGDSDDIAAYYRGKYPKGNFLSVELTAAEQGLLAEMNDFGANIRRFAYGMLLKGSPHLVKNLWSAHATGFQKLLSDVFWFPAARFLLVRLLKIHEKGVVRSKAKVEEMVDKFDALLADGREYLNGKALSELDIVFCSLAAPLVLEPKYGGAKLFTLDQMDPASRAAIAPFQDRPFAKYCHRIYAKHR